MTRKRKYIVLFAICISAVLSIAIGAVNLYFSSDPPIGKEMTTDPDKYLETNRYIKRTVKNDYFDILPSQIPAQCAAEYYYNYDCNYDGDLYFVIYLKLQYNGDEFRAAEESVLKGCTGDIREINDKTYVIYSLPDLERYFNGDSLSVGYRFSDIVLNKAGNTVEYFVSYQCDNKNIPDMAGGLFDDLSE